MEFGHIQLGADCQLILLQGICLTLMRRRKFEAPCGWGFMSISDYVNVARRVKAIVQGIDPEA